MAKSKGGRPSGRVLHAEAFEAIRNLKQLPGGTGPMTKRHVADESGISPQFIADLLAHRGGATDEVAAAIAQTLDVPIATIFPEVAGWVSPLPDRDAARNPRRPRTAS